MTTTLRIAGGPQLASTVIAGALALTICGSAQANFLMRVPLFGSATAAAATGGATLPAAQMALSVGPVDFGSVAITSSAVQTTTLTNSGTAPGATDIQDPAAPFSLVHDCPTELQPGSSCTLTVTFSPAVGGAVTGSIAVAGQSLSLTGYGDPILVAALTGGTEFAIALSIDGTLHGIGLNGYGQVGTGTTTLVTQYTQMIDISGAPISGVTAVDAGNYHVVALKNDGTVWATGYNNRGQLGNGATVNSSRFVQMTDYTGAPITNVASVAAGPEHVVVRKSDGTAWAVGYNSGGLLADGTTSNRSRFVQMTDVSGAAVTGVAQVDAGTSASFVLKADGTVWGAGSNSTGLVSDGGAMTSRTRLVQMRDNTNSLVTDATQIVTNNGNSYVLRSGGSAWAAGEGGWGLCATGNTVDQPLLVPMTDSTGAPLTGVSALRAHPAGLQVLAHKQDGTVWLVGMRINVWTWPADYRAEQTLTSTGVPITNVAMLSVQGTHAFAVEADGTAWHVGSNAYRQANDGTTTSHAQWAPAFLP